MASLASLTMPKVTEPSLLILEFGGYKIWEYNSVAQNFLCKLCAVAIARRSLSCSNMCPLRSTRNIWSWKTEQQGSSYSLLQWTQGNFKVLPK